jgi:hypothetical protein
VNARRLRIFISSPGDVGQERLIAARVLERLQGEFAGAVELEPILWEHEPLRASAHFQEQIIPPSETDIVLCILWSRLGTRLPDQFRREDGSHFASGTEWEFEDALRAFRERGAPDLMVYRKTAEPHASISNEAALLQRLEQKRALDTFVDRWFGNPTDSFRVAFHAFDSPDKFETLLETHLRRLIQERLPKHAVGHTEGAAPIQWHRGSPFRGLEAFDVEHAPVFFGRTRAITGIKEALIRQAENGCAFVLVFGMSGCGKSSLVRAGVLPTITQPGVIDGIGLWRWGTLRPSDAPADLHLALAWALCGESALPELADQGLEPHELAALFRQAPERAAAAVQRSLARAAESVSAAEGLTRAPQARLAVLVDQLEEIFTLSSVDARAREGFIAAVTALARSGCVWVIATMRSDFYPLCADLPALAALKEGGGQYDVLPPSFAEIGQIIRCPARAAGLSFEANVATGEHLDERLHEAAARDPEALPLLQFTLDELFQQRSESGVLTIAAYERLGGLEGALARRAEEVFSALEPAVQAVLPGVLRGLVTVGQSGGDAAAARRTPIGSLATTPERRRLLDAFIEARLLVTDRADDGEPVVRVAHEALLRRWPRVQEWLEEDRAFLRTRERVAAQAHRWQEEARNGDFLLAEGKPLADAQDLLARRRDDLDASLVEYTETSWRAVVRTRQRRLGLIGGSGTVFFAVVLGFGVFSFGQWQKADQQKKLALEAVKRLTYDIPKRLIDLPGSRPALRRIFQENVGLLDRIGDARAQEEKRANFGYMGDMWLLLGESEQAAQAYQKSLEIAQRLAQQRRDAPSRWELAVCQTKMGDVRLERGDASGALSFYRRSLQGLQELARRDHGARLRRDLSAGYEKIGDASLALNDLPGALKAYENDLAIATELARGTNSAQARRDLSVSLAKIGDARLAAGDVPAALAMYQRSGALLRELTKQGDALAQRDLAANETKIGDAHMSVGAAGKAQQAYTHALALARKLARDRTNARAQRDLEVSFTKIGDLRLALDDARGSLSAYGNGLVIARDLAVDKSNAAAQEDLKYLYERIRDARARLGDDRGALLAHEQSLAVAAEPLKPAKDAASRRELASLYRETGMTRVERRDLGGALQAYQSALEVCRELAGDGRDAAARRELASAYDRVAYVELLCRRPEVAIAIATEGAALEPREGRLQTTLAHGYLFANQFAKARALCLANRSLRVDDRQTFAGAVLSDFREFRAMGFTHPDMKKLEQLLTRTP